MFVPAAETEVQVRQNSGAEPSANPAERRHNQGLAAAVPAGETVGFEEIHLEEASGTSFRLSITYGYIAITHGFCLRNNLLPLKRGFTLRNQPIRISNGSRTLNRRYI